MGGTVSRQSVKKRASTERYAAHIVTPIPGQDACKASAVVVDPYYVATYAHADHTEWQVGHTVQVNGCNKQHTEILTFLWGMFHVIACAACGQAQITISKLTGDAHLQVSCSAHDITGLMFAFVIAQVHVHAPESAGRRREVETTVAFHDRVTDLALLKVSVCDVHI
jgi:hypothetical protein